MSILKDYKLEYPENWTQYFWSAIC